MVRYFIQVKIIIDTSGTLAPDGGEEYVKQKVQELRNVKDQIPELNQKRQQ